MRKAARIVLVFALVVGMRPAAAQQTTGNIAGVVVDVQGAAVPGATVTATSADTGLTRTVTTNAAGLYVGSSRCSTANMQWQSVADGKAKDTTERKGC